MNLLRGFLAAVLLVAFSGSARSGDFVDLALVLAVDASSSVDAQRQALPWTILSDPGEVEAMAEAIDRTPRLVAGGGTAIADAIDFAAGLFRGNQIRTTRRVIDVSGDGRGNMGPARSLDAALRAVNAGITINGLAILNEDTSLEYYYLTQVIGGASAFTMVADDYDDFAEAMLIKLITEIIGAPMF